MEFEDLKAEYSKEGTTDKRKVELIKCMQEYLQKVYGRDRVVCLDGMTYSTSSENVEDLYAIYGTYELSKSQERMSNIGNASRKEAFERNKFNPDNQYQESKK